MSLPMHTHMHTHTCTHTHTHTHQTPPEFTIFENQSTQTPFGILTTTDRDIGNNSEAFYYIVGKLSSEPIQSAIVLYLTPKYIYLKWTAWCTNSFRWWFSQSIWSECQIWNGVLNESSGKSSSA